MKSTNDMIFATLKTKASKPAKYAEQLRELGYRVEDTQRYEYSGGSHEYSRDYWAVNDLELYLEETDGSLYLRLRSGEVRKLVNIKRVDFVNYLETLEERKEKAERMNAHDAIEQVHYHWRDEETTYFNDKGETSFYYRWGWNKKVQRVRRHRMLDRNWTLVAYRELKRKADASGWIGREADAEIKHAERMLEMAEQEVEKLKQQLASAEHRVERRRQDIQDEVDKKAAGERELDAWLKAKGVRKAAC